MNFNERVAEAKREIRSRSMDGIERRFVGPGSLAGYNDADVMLETRDVPSGGWQIVGYGLVYNSWSEDLGGFREMIAPGACDEVLAGKPDIRGLINHNPDLILGRTSAGTMTVEGDPAGTRYVIDAPNTSYANDLRVSLDRRDITQSSFAFRIASGGSTWEEGPDGLLQRTILKFSGLFDMSPVTYPAYPSTQAGTHSASPDTNERTVDGPSAGERIGDGDVSDTQADETPWRLKDAQRRMALRDRV